MRELQSIVDYERLGIDPVFGMSSAIYWSSTSRAGLPDLAGFVNFYGGSVNGPLLGFDGKGTGNHVRAVRSEP